MTDLVPYATDSELTKYNDLARKILEAVEDGNITVIEQFALALQKNRHFSALILANMLTKLQDNWAKIVEVNDIHEDFISFVEGELLIKPQTTTKYINMWRAIFENPNISDDVKNRLKYKSINFLLRLPALAYENPPDEVWEQVLACESVGELRELIRTLRGEVTSSKTAITFYYLVREGTIVAKQGEEEVILAVTAKNSEKRELQLRLLAVMLDRMGAVVK